MADEDTTPDEELGPEPGSSPDILHGLPGDAEPLPEGDADADPGPPEPEDVFTQVPDGVDEGEIRYALNASFLDAAKLPRHEATRLDGKPINWNKPPKPTDMVAWSKKTTSGHSIRGSFRTICHMNRLNNLAIGKYGRELQVIQPDWNTGVAASAGTHDFDACWDVYIPGVSWWEQQRFLRKNGFACWYRHPPLFGNHVHGFTLPPREGNSISDDFKVHGFKVGVYVDGGWSTRGRQVASSQIEDYYNHAFGLAGQHEKGSDHSWFPKDIPSTIFDLGAYVGRRKR